MKLINKFKIDAHKNLWLENRYWNFNVWKNFDIEEDKKDVKRTADRIFDKLDLFKYIYNLTIQLPLTNYRCERNNRNNIILIVSEVILEKLSKEIYKVMCGKYQQKIEFEDADFVKYLDKNWHKELNMELSELNKFGTQLKSVVDCFKKAKIVDVINKVKIVVRTR